METKALSASVLSVCVDVSLRGGVLGTFCERVGPINRDPQVGGVPIGGGGVTGWQ